jgi:hypothetical protein
MGRQAPPRLPVVTVAYLFFGAAGSTPVFAIHCARVMQVFCVNTVPVETCGLTQ